MSIEKSPELDPCGCCEAPVSPTPEEIYNRPGLSATRYRVGTYASFRQAMLQAIAGKLALRDWTARSSDDYGIALLEMWAYLADILTFYQERIANEAFLRTALLRESVLRLAELLDYKPAPGVAATTYLAFTLEKGKQVQIPIGLKVQSVPGQDEKPQKFETVETITADARLNQLRIFPKPVFKNPLAAGERFGTLISGGGDLAPGDSLVVFEEGILSQGPEEKEMVDLRTVDWRRELHWQPGIRETWTFDSACMRKWRRKYRLFGYNAPSTYLEPVVSNGKVTWECRTVGFAQSLGNTLHLDGIYEDLKANTKILVVAPVEEGILHQVRHITEVSQASKQLIGTGATQPVMEATVTRIKLSPGLLQTLSDIRQVTIYELAGPEIELWSHTYEDSNISDNMAYVPLDQFSSLERGRTVLIYDGIADPAVVTVERVIPVIPAVGDIPHLAIEFSAALPSVATSTVMLYGNVVKATHGETVTDEVLGSGDASAEFQSFAIKKSPVTFVPQPGALHGAANTLQVRAGGVLWHEVNTLYGQEKDERVYTTTVDDEGVMTIQFGDGQTGARLLTGRNNATATYRQGLGREGNVNANSLTTLLDRPIGLKSVTNPGAAQGGTDPETLAEARTNAPNTVRTFGRIVSLRDFEDAAREFAGVAKARATWVWDGEEQVVQLTVAGDEGARVIGDTYENLVKDLNSRRDPNHKLVIGPHRQVFVAIEARIQVNPDYVDEQVQTAAGNALLDYFAFENVDLGQSIHLSDVYRVLQDVEGVVAVDINRLQYKDEGDQTSHGATAEPVQGHLRVFPAELAAIERPINDALVNIGMESL